MGTSWNSGGSFWAPENNFWLWGWPRRVDEEGFGKSILGENQKLTGHSLSSRSTCWVKDWTRFSVEIPSNLNHSMIVGSIKELNTILSSLWSLFHFSVLHKAFLLKVLNIPCFCFLKATGKFVPVTQPELYFEIYMFPYTCNSDYKTFKQKGSFWSNLQPS